MIAHLTFNAVVAGFAAVILSLVPDRWRPSTTVMHFFWFAVLVRLIMPPIFHLPMDLTHDSAANRSTGQMGLVPTEPAVVQSLLSEFTRFRSWFSGYESLLATIWLVGAIGVMFVSLKRGLRLERLICKTGFSNDDIVRTVREAGDQMGLRCVPEVRFVRGKISPMLWAFLRRPVLLLPTDLWSTLGDDQRKVVLRHELGHFRRRDHWVRVAEALATITHWWCPVLWWTRRELHHFEERSCDALAAVGPADRLALAQACLRTVDFITQKESRGVGFAVTPMTGFDSLKDRLQFILEGPRDTGRRSWTMPRILVALVLAASPSIANEANSSSVETLLTADSSNDRVPKSVAGSEAPFLRELQGNISRLKMLAFQQLTGTDLSQVVANSVISSFSQSVEEIGLPKSVRRDLFELKLRSSRPELHRLLRAKGSNDMSFEEIVELTSKSGLNF